MINNDKTRNPYTLNGSATHFAYEFKIFAATDLQIVKRKLDGSEQAINYPADCSVTGAGTENGGEVVLNSPGTNGEVLVIRRNLPKTQPFSFRNQPAFFPERHEDAYDRIVMLLQQLTEETSRSIQLPVTFTGTAELDSLVDGYCVGVIANGDGSFRVMMVANSGAQQTADLASISSAGKGPGMIGFNYSLAYAPGTTGKAVKDVMDRATILEAAYRVCEGRLTLISGAAVSADAAGKTSVYFTPFNGNRLALYTGTAWALRTFTEGTIPVPATTNLPFDIFAYDNAGVVAYETVNWANATTRATGLVYQDGVLVKGGGATTRRYLGTGCTTGVSGQIEDSQNNRYLWNYYNRVPRKLRVYDTTSTWNYTTAAWRQMNGSAANQANFVVGLAEIPVRCQSVLSFSNSTAGATATAIHGIGMDATNNIAGGCILGSGYAATAGAGTYLYASLLEYPPVGKHFVAPLEYSAAIGLCTWYGNASCGLIGELPA